MLAEYLHRAGIEPPVSRILLICKEPLVNLYAGVGFQNLGPSICARPRPVDINGNGRCGFAAVVV